MLFLSKQFLHTSLARHMHLFSKFPLLNRFSFLSTLTRGHTSNKGTCIVQHCTSTYCAILLQTASTGRAHPFSPPIFILVKLLTCILGCQVTEYLERLSDVRGLSKMALRRVEHLYYKNDMVYGAMRKLVQQQQAATAQQTTQTAQEGSDEAVEAEDLDEEQTEAKQVNC